MFHLIKNLVDYCRAAQEKTMTIVFLGLDNAGKSTIIADLQGGTVVVPP